MLSYLDLLEQRLDALVPLDRYGWSMFESRVGDQTIYVAPNGDDSASGLPSEPLRTPQAALNRCRPGTGDRVLLRRGGVWQNSKLVWPSGLSGASPSRPIYVGAYGRVGDPLPRIDGLDGSGVSAYGTQTSGPHNIAICDLHLRSRPMPEADASHGMTAIFWLAPSRGLTIEGCVVEGFTAQIYLQGWDGAPLSEARVRRNTTINPYFYGSYGGAVSYYINCSRGMLFEENVFGSTDEWLSAGNKPPSHGAYLNEDGVPAMKSRDHVVRGNLAVNCAKGISGRCGPIRTRRNAVIGCGIGLIFGKNADLPAEGPVETIDDYVEGSKQGVAEYPGWDARGVGWAFHSMTSGSFRAIRPTAVAADQSRDDQHKAITSEIAIDVEIADFAIDGYEAPNQPPGQNAAALWLDAPSGKFKVGGKVRFFGERGTVLHLQGAGATVEVTSPIAVIGPASTIVSLPNNTDSPLTLNPESLANKPRSFGASGVLLAALRDLRRGSPRLYMLGTNISRNRADDARGAMSVGTA